ncbi:hypothetical protein ACU639_00805 [Streptomyces cynarae]|uniref:hypothetical protein n=1 Tax=Streptomyces cynarae TaxID=2981134 RepID=UPI00406C03CC
MRLADRLRRRLVGLRHIGGFPAGQGGQALPPGHRLQRRRRRLLGKGDQPHLQLEELGELGRERHRLAFDGADVQTAVATVALSIMVNIGSSATTPSGDLWSGAHGRRDPGTSQTTMGLRPHQPLGPYFGQAFHDVDTSTVTI